MRLINKYHYHIKIQNPNLLNRIVFMKKNDLWKLSTFSQTAVELKVVRCMNVILSYNGVPQKCLNYLMLKLHREIH